MILKVLIVEDEEIIRKGLVSTIDWLSMDCSVIGSAADGCEGLKMILDLQPDVVITDIRMPGMSGIDMLSKAEEAASFRSILLTSYAEFDYAQRAIELRAYEYLLKPLDEEKLRTVMEKIHSDAEKDILLSRLQMIDDQTPLFDVHQERNDQDELVSYVMNKVEHESNLPLSIESIANELFVSPSYLSRKLKAATGKTFLELLNIHRVRQAVRLMNTGSTSVSEIAEKTGFHDFKHFYNVFKRYTGITPKEYINGCKR